MLKAFFFSPKGITVLPFWNESIIANNLANFTAVVENGQFSIYKNKRLITIKLLFQTIIKVLLWSFRINKKDFNSNNSTDCII